MRNHVKETYGEGVSRPRQYVKSSPFTKRLISCPFSVAALIIVALILEAPELFRFYCLFLAAWAAMKTVALAPINQEHCPLYIFFVLFLFLALVLGDCLSGHTALSRSLRVALSNAARHIQTCWENPDLVTMTYKQFRAANVLSLSYVCRLGSLAYEMIVDAQASKEPITWETHGEVLLSRSCETALSVIGMSCLLGKAMLYLTEGFRAYLGDREIEKQAGVALAVLSHLLVVQAGLASSDPELRVHRLCQNLCILALVALRLAFRMATWQFSHLIASRDSSHSKLYRTSLAWILLPCAWYTVLAHVSDHHMGDLGSWSLTRLRLLDELVTTALMHTYIFTALATERDFTMDARDECYFRGSTADFMIGCSFFAKLHFNGSLFSASYGEMILFCVSLWSWGLAILSLINYFAIDTVFLHMISRFWNASGRGSVKLERCQGGFREATPEELIHIDDVCPICWDKMETAVRTICSHYFHGGCLRSWLRDQKSCAVCRRTLKANVGAWYSGGDIF